MAAEKVTSTKLPGSTVTVPRDELMSRDGTAGGLESVRARARGRRSGGECVTRDELCSGVHRWRAQAPICGSPDGNARQPCDHGPARVVDNPQPDVQCNVPAEAARADIKHGLVRRGAAEVRADSERHPRALVRPCWRKQPGQTPSEPARNQGVPRGVKGREKRVPPPAWAAPPRSLLRPRTPSLGFPAYVQFPLGQVEASPFRTT